MSGRTVFVRDPPEPPPALANILNDPGPIGQEFRKNTRLYNSLLSFASMRASYDKELANRQNNGVYTYRINGEVYHTIADVGNDFHQAKFGEIYIYDPEMQLNRRRELFNDINEDTLGRLQAMMMEHNRYARVYQSLGAIVRNNGDDLPNISIRILPAFDRGRQYDLPQDNEVQYYSFVILASYNSSR
jgi:hypothetical protein